MNSVFVWTAGDIVAISLAVFFLGAGIVLCGVIAIEHLLKEMKRWWKK